MNGIVIDGVEYSYELLQHLHKHYGDPTRLTFDSFQNLSKASAVYPFKRWREEAINYCVMGLVGEAGEIANKWKKVLRDPAAHYEDVPEGERTRAFDVGELGLRQETREALMQEIGDVLWYVAQLATELGVGLGTIAKMNQEKLISRKTRNVLKGSGDVR